MRSGVAHLGIPAVAGSHVVRSSPDESTFSPFEEAHAGSTAALKKRTDGTNKRENMGIVDLRVGRPLMRHVRSRAPPCDPCATPRQTDFDWGVLRHRN